MKTRIMIVDDDPLICKMLSFLFAEGGYETVTVSDPRGVTAALEENTVDLILLDVMLPYIDGYALCAALRRNHASIPIVFLSARVTVRDKVDGFEHGADDYVSKPFEPTELLARVQAVLRRYSQTERNQFGSVLRVGETSLNLGELQFHASTRHPVLLTPTEMKILECLMRNANMVINRETLIERTWGYDYEGGSNRVDVYIRRLRNKIELDPNQPTFINTVRGIGYVYRDSRHTA